MRLLYGQKVVPAPFQVRCRKEPIVPSRFVSSFKQRGQDFEAAKDFQLLPPAPPRDHMAEIVLEVFFVIITVVIVLSEV
jgi:hypothetical protein